MKDGGQVTVRELKYEHGVDMQQLFAQLAIDIDGGAQWWLTADEEAMLESLNRRHQTVSAIAEKLAEYVDPDDTSGKRVANVTTTEMLELMGYKQPTNPQMKECAAALRVLVGESKRSKGINRWKVPLKEATADVWKPLDQRQIINEIF